MSLVAHRSIRCAVTLACAGLALLLPRASGAATIVFDDGGSHVFTGSTTEGVVVENTTTVVIDDPASLLPPGSGCAPFGSGFGLCVRGQSLVTFQGGSAGAVDAGVENATLEVTGGTLGDIIGSADISVSGGTVASIFVSPGSIEVTGGTVLGIVIGDLASVRVTGGDLRGGVFTFAEVATIEGGSFSGSFPSQVGDLVVLEAFASSVWDVSGGLFETGALWDVSGGSTLNVFGSDLVLAPIPGVPGQTPRSLLTGRLLDGSPLSVDVFIDGDRGSEVNLFNVPEPGLALTALFAVAFLGRRRRR